MNELLTRIVEWIRAGYPEGVPGPDRVPLFALLKRRLTDDEVAAVAAELISSAPDGDIGALIAQITHEPPSDEEIERVKDHLTLQGWLLDEEEITGGK